MKDLRNSGKREFFMNGIKIAVLVLLVTGVNLVSFSARADDREDACSETSKYAKTACYNAENEVYQLALGKCENELEGKQDSCESDANADLELALLECDDQFAARQAICKEVGPGPYLPRGIKPFKFITDRASLTGNDYFPLIPATYTYKSFNKTHEITETDVVKVTNETRKILDALCRVVQDTVYAGDIDKKTDSDLLKLKREDTTDWFAQQDNGDVWYFGEIAQQFKQDSPGEKAILVGIDGSWTAGVDGAKPGIIMFKKPQEHIGKSGYRQEFALGEAEDDARVFEILTFEKLKQNLDYQFVLGKLPTNLVKDTTLILHTQDFSALDPGSVLESQYEDKYYAKGVGLILIIANDGTEIKEVLVDKK